MANSNPNQQNTPSLAISKSIKRTISQNVGYQGRLDVGRFTLRFRSDRMESQYIRHTSKFQIALQRQSWAAFAFAVAVLALINILNYDGTYWWWTLAFQISLIAVFLLFIGVSYTKWFQMNTIFSTACFLGAYLLMGASVSSEIVNYWHSGEFAVPVFPMCFIIGIHSFYQITLGVDHFIHATVWGFLETIALTILAATFGKETSLSIAVKFVIPLLGAQFGGMMFTYDRILCKRSAFVLEKVVAKYWQRQEQLIHQLKNKSERAVSRQDPKTVSTPNYTERKQKARSSSSSSNDEIPLTYSKSTTDDYPKLPGTITREWEGNVKKVYVQPCTTVKHLTHTHSISSAISETSSATMNKSNRLQTILAGNEEGRDAMRPLEHLLGQPRNAMNTITMEFKKSAYVEAHFQQMYEQKASKRILWLAVLVISGELAGVFQDWFVLGDYPTLWVFYSVGRFGLIVPGALVAVLLSYCKKPGAQEPRIKPRYIITGLILLDSLVKICTILFLPKSISTIAIHLYIAALMRVVLHGHISSRNTFAWQIAVTAVIVIIIAVTTFLIGGLNNLVEFSYSHGGYLLVVMGGLAALPGREFELDCRRNSLLALEFANSRREFV